MGVLKLEKQCFCHLEREERPWSLTIKTVKMLDQGLIGVKQQDIGGEDLSGKYYFNGDDGGYGDVEVDNAANTYSGSYTEPDGNEQTIRGNLHRNSPWEGWLTSDNYTEADSADDNIILILPGDGVFLQTSPEDNTWIDVGGKIP